MTPTERAAFEKHWKRSGYLSGELECAAEWGIFYERKRAAEAVRTHKVDFAGAESIHHEALMHLLRLIADQIEKREE